MSRARSVPALIAANSAPWMNGTASAKARYESVGKPGICVAALQAARVDREQHQREDQRRDDMRGLAQRARDRAAGDGADLFAGAPLTRGRALAARPPRRRPRASARSSPGRRRRAWAACSCRSATRSSSASSARTISAQLAVAAGRAARRRAAAARASARRSARSTSRERARASPGSAGHDLDASGCRSRPSAASGVPSATIWPWSMIPTRSASTSASSRYCVVRKTVMPSSRASRADLLPQRGAALRVEAGRRLVEEQDARAVDERQREVEAALHAARVAADLAVGRLGQPDALEQLVDRARCARAAACPCSVACSRRCSRPVRNGSSAASCSAAPIDARTCGPWRTTSKPPTRRAARSSAAAASSASARSSTCRRRSGPRKP